MRIGSEFSDKSLKEQLSSLSKALESICADARREITIPDDNYQESNSRIIIRRIENALQEHVGFSKTLTMDSNCDGAMESSKVFTRPDGYYLFLQEYFGCVESDVLSDYKLSLRHVASELSADLAEVYLHSDYDEETHNTIESINPQAIGQVLTEFEIQAEVYRQDKDRALPQILQSIKQINEPDIVFSALPRPLQEQPEVIGQTLEAIYQLTKWRDDSFFLDRLHEIAACNSLSKAHAFELEKKGYEILFRHEKTAALQKYVDKYEAMGSVEELGILLKTAQGLLQNENCATLLLGGEQGEVYHAADQRQPEPKKPFALPNAHTDMRRTYAYLVKSRGIDREVVSFFAKEKLLYESCEKSKDGTKEYRNAVFVGCDENGVPRHAHKRGLYTFGEGFKGNVDSSSPEYSFHHSGTSNQLYVFEAPIDMLSFISLHPQDWQAHSYVALCGVGSQAMHWMLTQNPQLNKLALCLDNDEAGHKAAARMREQLAEGGYLVERLLPNSKDWNDDLLMHHVNDQVPEDVREIRDACQSDGPQMAMQ